MPVVNGQLIRERRQRTGLRLGTFAEAVGIKKQTLANAESGHPPRLSIEALHRIAKALTERDEPSTAQDFLMPADSDAA